MRLRRAQVEHARCGAGDRQVGEAAGERHARRWMRPAPDSEQRRKPARGRRLLAGSAEPGEEQARAVAGSRRTPPLPDRHVGAAGDGAVAAEEDVSRHRRRARGRSTLRCWWRAGSAAACRRGPASARTARRPGRRGPLRRRARGSSSTLNGSAPGRGWSRVRRSAALSSSRSSNGAPPCQCVLATASARERTATVPSPSERRSFLPVSGGEARAARVAAP